LAISNVRLAQAGGSSPDAPLLIHHYFHFTPNSGLISV